MNTIQKASATHMNYVEKLHVFQSPYHKDVQMNVVVSVPEDFSADEKLPMMVFLHGAGERGNDTELLAIHGLLKYTRKGNFPHRAVVVSPQVPSEELTWSHLWAEANDLILQMEKEYHVDENRVTLTGISMGGFGTWEIGMMHPDHFAAIAPICGGGMSWRSGALVNTPVRAFHGDADDTVELCMSQVMVDAINRQGGKASLTIFHDVGHNSWAPAYEDTNLISWLYAQKKA